MNKLEDILLQIEEKIDQPFITARFGNNWKEHAKKNYDIDTIINLAWRQGRRSILLEEALKELLDDRYK